jgi:hypothetical protein
MPAANASSSAASNVLLLQLLLLLALALLLLLPASSAPSGMLATDGPKEVSALLLLWLDCRKFLNDPEAAAAAVNAPEAAAAPSCC